MSRPSLADTLLSHQFRSELEQILGAHNRKVRTKTKVIGRDCSTKTAYERASNIRRAFAELNQLGYKLQSPRALKPKHILVLAAHWQRKGLSPKTLHCQFSNLREFGRWIGKHDLVQDIGVYFGGREHLVRKVAASCDLSWEANGVDVPAFMLKVKDLDRRLWVMLLLQRYFGLRAKESIEFRPWRATAMQPEFLSITDGTKGGRHRIVPVRTELQQEIIASAKDVVGSALNAQMRWPGMTWHQAQAHFYHLMHELGVTKGGIGVTAHGLRHGYLQSEFHHYSGVLAPIKQGSTLPASKADYQHALLATSLEAGHFRPSATTIYTGSVGHQLRSSSDVIKPDSSDAGFSREEP